MIEIIKRLNVWKWNILCFSLNACAAFVWVTLGTKMVKQKPTGILLLLSVMLRWNCHCFNFHNLFLSHLVCIQHRWQQANQREMRCHKTFWLNYFNWKFNHQFPSRVKVWIITASSRTMYNATQVAVFMQNHFIVFPFSSLTHISLLRFYHRFITIFRFDFARNP